MNELSLFSGAGGGILGGKLLGWRTICAVEIDPYARAVLAARQNDGTLTPFPIWDDVRTFRGKPWNGLVDIVTGGFPCQDISAAGKGAGIDGARSGLWGEFARIICEVGPRYVLVENSPMLTSRGLGRVLGDLASMGYDARWGVLGAHHAGAPHKRDRIWIVADNSQLGWRTRRKRGFDSSNSRKPEFSLQTLSESVADAESIRKRESTDKTNPIATCGETRLESLCSSERGRFATDADSSRELQPEGHEQKKRKRSGNGNATPADHDRAGRKKQRPKKPDGREFFTAECNSWWTAEPGLVRMAHGIPHRVDRLRCLGNAQVPAMVPLAWNIISTPHTPTE